MRAPRDLDAALDAAGFALPLFNRLPDVVFFVKDAAGRYAAVNTTLVQRLGRRHASQILGRTARDLFPAPLGERYLEQDLGVLGSGRDVADLLELHLYPDRREGWCLTNKVPIRGSGGRVIGLVGTSRDVQTPAQGPEGFADLAEAVRTIREEFRRPLRVESLAALARVSPWQLTRRIRALFGLTPAQLIIRTRLDAARLMLAAGDEPIGQVAIACGYCDQSAFTRQFKASIGLTPAQYRQRAAS
ncbi:MAG TPA: AraC family transcriptional regulator [Thermoanaerobaculia bacterium]|nr:AraC family transcriptional regulator [Thermoanaerobaculia bacterium]